mmetsp:Transcript_83065/g.209357  ORF Transcript_83065/g.209357 Transcript_83065/m.209357 type:complete len:205 (-) Transcript_83065:384-998(-)
MMGKPRYTKRSKGVRSGTSVQSSEARSRSSLEKSELPSFWGADSSRKRPIRRATGSKNSLFTTKTQVDPLPWPWAAASNSTARMAINSEPSSKYVYAAAGATLIQNLRIASFLYSFLRQYAQYSCIASRGVRHNRQATWPCVVRSRRPKARREHLSTMPACMIGTNSQHLFPSNSRLGVSLWFFTLWSSSSSLNCLSVKLKSKL